LLHVYKGFIRIPHAGLYRFALFTSGIGEISIGDQVVNGVDLADLDASRPVKLSEGFVPVTIKLAKAG
jgi:hypothetical protein